MNPLKTKLDNHVMNIQFETYFTIGDKEFTRAQLMDMECPNFVAARRLEKALKRLKVKSIKGLYEIDPFALYNTRGVGFTQVFVAMCVLEMHKFDSQKWWDNFTEPKSRREKQVV